MPKAQIHTRVIRVEREESNTLEINVFGAGHCTLTMFGFCIPIQQEPLHRKLHQEHPLEEDNQGVPFLFPERYTAEWNYGPPTIDMIPDDPTDETVFDRVTHFVPLVSGQPYDEDDPDPRLQHQGLFLEMVTGPEEEKEPYEMEHEGVDHDIKFEGTFRRVGFGE
jgi:hypothetical protein